VALGAHEVIRKYIGLLMTTTRTYAPQHIRFTNKVYAATLFTCITLLLISNVMLLLSGWIITLIPISLHLGILIAGIAKHRSLITFTRVWAALAVLGGAVGLLRGLLIGIAYVLDPAGHSETSISAWNVIGSAVLTAGGLYFYLNAKSFIPPVSSGNTGNETEESINKIHSAGS